MGKRTHGPRYQTLQAGSRASQGTAAFQQSRITDVHVMFNDKRSLRTSVGVRSGGAFLLKLLMNLHTTVYGGGGKMRFSQSYLKKGFLERARWNGLLRDLNSVVFLDGQRRMKEHAAKIFFFIIHF